MIRRIAKGVGIVLAALLALVVIGYGASSVARVQVRELAAPTGPSAVGRVELALTDATRVDPFSSDGRPRELAVWIWYPAAKGGAGAAAPYLPKTWADAANNVNGELRDVCVSGGKVVADVAGGRTIDAAGMVVFPGGVDVHTHVAGAALNFARGLIPEQHRNAHPIVRNAVRRAGVGGRQRAEGKDAQNCTRVAAPGGRRDRDLGLRRGAGGRD